MSPYDSMLSRVEVLKVLFFFFFFFCLFVFSKAAPVAYGDSHARGLIGALAAGRESEPRLCPTPQLMATLDS